MRAKRSEMMTSSRPSMNRSKNMANLRSIMSLKMRGMESWRSCASETERTTGCIIVLASHPTLQQRRVLARSALYSEAALHKGLQPSPAYENGIRNVIRTTKAYAKLFQGRTVDSRLCA